MASSSPPSRSSSRRGPNTGHPLDSPGPAPPLPSPASRPPPTPLAGLRSQSSFAPAASTDALLPISSASASNLHLTGEGMAHHRTASGLAREQAYTEVHTHAHGRELHAHDAPLGMKHLFRFPVVRQFIGPSAPTHPVLYRSAGERTIEKAELLFDLVFVGLVHVLAEVAVKDVSGLSAAKFILLFTPAFIVWMDMRSFTNESGVDDIPQRLYMVAVMILLVGYGGNASGIEIEDLDKKPSADDDDLLSSGSGHHRRALFFPRQDHGSSGSHDTGDSHAASTTLSAAHPVSTATGSHGAEEADSDDHDDDGKHSATVLGTSLELPAAAHPALQWAVAFFLIAKGLRLTLHLIYAVYLPRFRVSQFVNGLSSLSLMLILVPLLFIRRFEAIITLAGLALVVGIGWRFVVGAVLAKRGRGKIDKHLARGKHCIVAKDMSHLIERNAGFVVLVIGESIMNIFYEAHPGSGDAGLSSKFIRGALGVICSSCFAFLYFDQDSGRVFRHALRIHWLTSLTYDALHLPLTSAVILMSAAMKHMVALSEMTEMTRWYFGATTAVTMYCLAAMGYLHRSRDLKGSSRVPRSWRLAGRLVAGVVMNLLPAVIGDMSSTNMFGIYALILVLQLAFETFGKLGATPDPEPYQGVAGELKYKKSGKRWGRSREGANGADLEKDLDEAKKKMFVGSGSGAGEKSPYLSPAPMGPGVRSPLAGQMSPRAEEDAENWAETIAGGDGFGREHAFGRDQAGQGRDPHSHPPAPFEDPTAFRRQRTGSGSGLGTPPMGGKPFLLQGRYMAAPATVEYHRDELTPMEQGEDDLGLDQGLGDMKAVRIEHRQVFAYAA